jgi:lysylphosphatidylglycerol synthetase-like protein (DUF2156 family)
VATALVAFLLYQALSVMKLIGTIISFGLAVVTAILLQMFMWDVAHRANQLCIENYFFAREIWNKNLGMRTRAALHAQILLKLISGLLIG